MRPGLACAATALTLALAAPTAQAALPGSDYDFSYFKDAGHSVLVNVEGRRSLGDGVGFSIDTGCVPSGTGTVGKPIAISSRGTFKTTRTLRSDVTGRTAGRVALRGKFTSKSRLVLRARFARGSCKTREYRFVLRGSPPAAD